MASPSQQRATEPGPPGCSERVDSPTPRSQRFVILPKGQRDLAVGLRPPLCRRPERQRSRHVDLRPCPRRGWLGSLSSEDGRVCSPSLCGGSGLEHSRLEPKWLLLCISLSLSVSLFKPSVKAPECYHTPLMEKPAGGVFVMVFTRDVSSIIRKHDA